jgi:heme-degrading monooxygenase HmoA
MILAVSRFRVANGREAQVCEAFLNRPGLVDSTPGFLGLEIFNDAKDATVFYLVTRWTDSDTFQVWHKSPDHRLSHKLIPKGLKLDPAFTRVMILDRLQRADGRIELAESVMDAAPFIARYLSSSKTVHFLAAASDGILLACSQAVAAGLKAPISELVGTPLWNWLTQSDAAGLREMINSGDRRQQVFLINFSDSENHPYTLEAALDIYPDGFVLLGEPPLKQTQALQDELLKLNNELSVLTRENVRQNKSLRKAQAELEKAHEELKNSHWHLKKIQEVLPICMMCQKVKTSEGQWDDLIKYFKDNSNFLSHSYCPECGRKAIAQFEDSKRKGSEGK